MIVTDVKPVDPKTMTESVPTPVLPTFEGTEIDRGQGKPKGAEGYHIVMRKIEVWHVTEGNRTQLPETSHGHFHSGLWIFLYYCGHVYKDKRE